MYSFSILIFNKLAVSDKILSNSSEAFTPTIILFAKGNGIL